MNTHLHRWAPTGIAVLALVVAAGGPGEARQLISGHLIKKGTVSSKQLKDGGIRGKDVRDGDLTGADLADGTVDTADVADGSVAGTDLRAGAVSTTKLADGAVTGTKLADGAVTGTKLATGSVTSGKLARNSVTGGALEIAGFTFLDFPLINAHTCALQLVLALGGGTTVPDGSLSDDVVLATPDAFFGGNFSFSVKSEGAGAAYVKLCNVGTTNVDMDGVGGTWRYVAIDVS